MPDNPPCQECEKLRKESHEAYRYAFGYRPIMHTGYRPKSRWCKADRDAEYNAQKIYNLAEANYRLHRGTHAPESINPRDAIRDMSIVMRGGRLKP